MSGSMDSSKGARDQALPEQRLVYVMPDGVFPGDERQVSLRELWSILWNGKWLIVAATVVFAVLSVVYALLATEWYRADVLLAPSEERSTPALGGQLGGLAALAGVTVGGGDSVQAVATLRSREFAREFIDEFSLLPILFADEWDEEAQRWRAADPEDSPDIRDAVRFFHEAVLKVSEDRQTNLVTLGIEWKNPDVAAEWANVLVQRLNLRLRARALREAEANVAYLQQELAQTTVVTLQQSIGRLLESELQKLMLARGNEEFAFRIMDPAQAPKERVRPKRALIAVVGTMLGGMLGVFLVFLLHAVRGSESSGIDPIMGSQ